MLGILAALCGLSMLLERLGVPTTLALDFKGDVKRETRWLAQYGQSICTVVVALLVWRLDTRHPRAWLVVLLAVGFTTTSSFIIKRLAGRVRPGRENAGKFLGPTIHHANYRESFPSSHSSCALALTVVLSMYYPSGAGIFWTLALTCAVLRYIMDAHWPSDVFGGLALGYALAHLTCCLLIRA